jgi:6-phosphogluconolactonase (cycloisomerase 2 family)
MTFTVGGTITGLAGTGLVISGGAGHTASPASGATSFTLSGTFAANSTYTIAFSGQPSSLSQTCAVTSGGTGPVTGNISTVAITCTTNTYGVSGTITGLAGAGLTISGGVGHTAAPGSGATTFALSGVYASGATYTVAVTGQPAALTQNCVVTSGGTGPITNAPITNVLITCTTSTFTVGGTITGYKGTGLVLKEATSNQTVTPANAATTFTFTTPVNSGASYTVSVQTTPTTPHSPVQNCTVTNATKTGTVTTANVASVIVDCSGLYVFAASPTDGTGTTGSLAAFTIDPVAGGLTAVTGSPYDESLLTSDIAPWGLAVDPSGSFLYVANSGSASISTDTIGAGGALTLDPAAPASTFIAPATAANAPYSLALDPTGPYLYTGTNDTPNGFVEGFSIAGGALAALTGSPYTSATPAAINEPFGLALDTTHSFLYAVNNFADSLVSYGITAGVLGELSASPDVLSPAMTTPYAVASYPSGTYFYVTDTGVTPGTVNVVTIDGTGILTVVQSKNVGTTPQAVVVDPTGKYLYVSNAGDGTVTAFTISGGGATLTGGVTGSPFTASGAASTAALPTALTIDSSGRFLYVANGSAGTISEFSIGAGGVLAPITGTPVQATIDVLGSAVGPVGIVTQ